MTFFFFFTVNFLKCNLPQKRQKTESANTDVTLRDMLQSSDITEHRYT